MPHPVVSRSFLLRMRNVSDESCGDAHLMFNYFFLGNHALYEIKGKYGTTRQATDSVTRRMRFAC